VKSNLVKGLKGKNKELCPCDNGKRATRAEGPSWKAVEI